MLFPKLTFWSVFLLGYFGSPDVAWASDGILGSDTTRIWLITCTLLVFLMQVGFLLLEAGATRSKNAINASFKNKSDLIISVLTFLLLGHVLVFGPTVGGYFGFGLPRIADWSPDEIIVMLYFAGFCATAATILSGAVCERFSLKAYLPTVCFIALIVAPIPMHWVSGADIIPGNTPFLVGLGFIDFAGATIIHGTGAWIALAALITVGPRLGRFDPKTGKPRYVEGYSSILSMAGALLLLIGWVGFNGGAALSFDENVSLVVSKTLFAGFFGGFVGLAICFLLKWKLHPVRLIESTIAGLVAVTAAPHLFSFAFVPVLVCVAVGVSFFVRSLLLKMGVDDVVNVVATHGFAGVIGTLAVTFAVPTENLVSGSRFAQLGVQSAGVLAVFVWSFSVAFIWFKLLNRVIPLRVERRAEQVGLNRSSHGALFSKDLFAQELENLLKSGDIYHTRLNLPEGDENYRLSRLFNRIMEDLRSARENENSERELREAQERELRLQAETAQVRAEEAANAMRSKEQAQRELRESAERSERAASEELLRKTQDAEAVSVCLQRAMKGDLEAEVTTSCASPEFEEIRIGVNALISTLSRNIGKIASSANEVTQRCDALTGISEVLNRRSADQIDSVQAITIKLGQMGESAEENRVMANDALEAARVSRDVSDNVTANLDNVTGAMDTIIDRTSKIEPIVDLIEEIAFQTTLLALNASVEAARAGEAGTGFKVVASEVRGLANRVQAHATDIRNIVDEASVAVSNGAKTVSHTSLSIAQISKTSLNVSSQIEEIHESTSVLRQQLFDLGKVVEDITEVASSNAHMAADAADGASALAALSALLLTGIELFNGYELVAETENDNAFQAVEVNNDEAGMVFF